MEAACGRAAEGRARAERSGVPGERLPVAPVLTLPPLGKKSSTSVTPETFKPKVLPCFMELLGELSVIYATHKK